MERGPHQDQVQGRCRVVGEIHLLFISYIFLFSFYLAAPNNFLSEPPENPATSSGDASPFPLASWQGCPPPLPGKPVTLSKALDWGQGAERLGQTRGPGGLVFE